MKDIIYIAGYGRSGSTLLERILGSNEKIFGLGEVKFLIDSISHNKYCSCGEKINNCNYWSEVIENLDLNSEVQNNKVNVKINKIYQEIINNTSDEVKYIIDSSKTARDAFFRPFLLSKNFNVKLIHLVRDGRGCMWSNIKGSNRKMEQGLDPTLKMPSLRTSISWQLSNLSPEIFKITKNSENYLRIKYEDFVTDPEIELKRLSSYLNIDLSEQIDMLINEKEIPLGHQIAGNRLRKKKKIILKKDIEWKSNLKFYNKLIYWFLCWPFALKYGYHKRDD